MAEGNARIELSISELADLTGFDRRAVTKKLEKFMKIGVSGSEVYGGLRGVM